MITRNGTFIEGPAAIGCPEIANNPNHAAAVAQAYKDAEVKIATIRQAFAEWESIRTFRDTDTPEWAALVAALED